MTVTVTVYLILLNNLISLDLYDFTSPFTHQFQFHLRGYIKHSRQCLGTLPKKPRSSHGQKYSAALSSLSVRNVVKPGLSCPMYCLKAKDVMRSHTRTSNQSFRHRRLKTVFWGSSKENIITSFKFEVDQKLIPDQDNSVLLSFRPNEKVNSVIFDGILTLRPAKQSVRKTNISAIN